MSLLEPWGLIALVGLPAIVALYLLRQRKPPRMVGSLLLWQMARAEVFRGRPWERFRPTALLWIQLLLMGLLAFALSRPACITEGSDTGKLVLVLDASASMAATDGDPDRWREAVEKARQTVQTAPGGSEIAILVAGRLTRVAAPFTRDRQQITRRLDTLAERGPDAVPSRIKEALLLGLQLGGDGEREIVLFSDGAFDQGELPALGPTRLSFVGVGSGSDNLAITTFEVRRAVGQRFGASVLCTVTNTGERALGGHLEIRAEGTVVEAQRVELAPGDSKSFGVPLQIDAGQLEARLIDVRGEDDAVDLLAWDNTAFAIVTPEAPVEVLLVGGDPLVERALKSNPRMTVTAIEPDDYTDSGGAGVVVFQDNFPATIPSGRFLVLGLPAENPLAPALEETVQTPIIASWDRGHPALLHLELSRVRFGQVPKVEPIDLLVPVGEFQGRGGPALLTGQTPSWRALIWTAPMMETDLALRVAFPVFLYNAIGWLSPGGERDAGRTLASGQPLAIPATGGDTVSVRAPDGTQTNLTLAEGAGDGVHLHPETGRPGFYRVGVESKGKTPTAALYGVSMVDLGESALKPSARLTMPGGGAVSAAGAIEKVDEKVSSLLWLALLVLAIEWGVWAWRARRRRWD